MTSRMVDLTPGTVLILEGTGLVTVLGQLEMHGVPYIQFEGASGGVHSLAVETVRKQDGVRSLVGPDVASRWLAVLRDTSAISDDRSFRVRTDEHMRALASGSDDDLVRSLRMLYASRYAVAAGERDLIEMLEERIIPELAHVLGLDGAQVIAELHVAHETFSGSAAARPDEAPHVVGRFSHVDDQLTVGDPVKGESWTFAAAHGSWKVYVEDHPTYGLPSAFVAIHDDVFDRMTELRGRLRAVEDLWIGNGAIAVFDPSVRLALRTLVGEERRRVAEQAEDENFTLEQVEIVHDRGIAILTRSGTMRAAVTVENGVAVLVFVDIGWPPTLETNVAG